jgi:hypothetical protein
VTNPRIANLASSWTLSFGAMHVLWALSYYWFPAFGRVTLGPNFQWSFGRAWAMAFDLVVAALFVLAAVLPLAAYQPWGTRVPRRVLLGGLWTAALILGARGAAGLAQVVLVLTGVMDVALTRWVVYDVWFFGCGMLLGAVARRVAAPRG